MSKQRHKTDDLARKARRQIALRRPELTRGDGMARTFTAAPFGPAIKQDDPATRALIDAALRARRDGALP